MNKSSTFIYSPNEQEAETASNSYLMSLIAIVIGLPLPIINLAATFIFYLGNRKGSYFVRWHCMQALWSQLMLVIVNSIGFWWTMSILFTEKEVSNTYFGYIITVILFNIIELAVTIYTAIQTRKGIHVSWWFYGPFTDKCCKQSL
jgi:uncharacterized membrane protein